MSFVAQIEQYKPVNEQEAKDQQVILAYCKLFAHNVLLRENEIAHITSSGFILNETLDQMLMIHHNIRGSWAWTGGHADGDEDLLGVAIKEAKEETGVDAITPLSMQIASIDILPVYGHVKNGVYVNAHLHLSIAYLLICPMGQALESKPDENSAVQWLPVSECKEPFFSTDDVHLYQKLIQKSKTAHL